MSTDYAYYVFVGNYNKESDYNNMYSCPCCGKTLHWGSRLRWYCDPCNTNWYDQSKLLANLSSNLCTNIPNNLDNKSPADIRANLPK